MHHAGKDILQRLEEATSLTLKVVVFWFARLLAVQAFTQLYAKTKERYVQQSCLVRKGTYAAQCC